MFARLESPSGAEVLLFDIFTTEESEAWPGGFQIGTKAFLGEASQGTWKLALFDRVSGNPANYVASEIEIYGAETTENSQFIFTREYSKVGEVISDTTGVDTINAAAVHESVTLNLNAGQTNQINADGDAIGTFTIAAGSVIENAIGGGGDDFITGNEAANLLRGSWGNDRINGQNGNDIIFGGQGQDILIGGQGSDVFILTEKSTARVGTGLGDTILDFEDGSDILQVSSSALARLDGWTGGTTGLTGREGQQGAQFLVVGEGSNATINFAQLVYNQASGELFVDVDGVGSKTVTLIGNIGSGLDLDANDFVFTA